MTTTFVVPALDGPETGGTIFNRELVAALRRRGEAIELRAEPGRALAWVDSLFLDRVADWAARAPVAVLTHYLPSLVEPGASEAAALAAADAFVVPSPYLARELERRGVDPGCVAVVEPGADLAPAPPRDPASAPHRLEVLLVANVTPAKGIEELVRALPDGEYALRVIGSLDVDPAYAARCRQQAGPRVRFEGSLPHAHCQERLRRCDLLLSASRMESYGMALAEARACGVPVLARDGGNVTNLVRAQAGGEVVPDIAALADAFGRLVHDRGLLQARALAAAAHRRRRSWDEVATDFIAGAATTTKTIARTRG